jgi:hypothetical protein
MATAHERELECCWFTLALRVGDLPTLSLLSILTLNAVHVI